MGSDQNIPYNKVEKKYVLLRKDQWSENGHFSFVVLVGMDETRLTTKLLAMVNGLECVCDR